MSKPTNYKPLSIGAIRKFWAGIDQAAELTDSTAKAIQRSFDNGRRVGEDLGARRERMMFKAWMKSWLAPDYPITIEVLAINNWLASRAKPAKRKGGRDGR